MRSGLTAKDRNRFPGQKAVDFELLQFVAACTDASRTRIVVDAPSVIFRMLTLSLPGSASGATQFSPLDPGPCGA
jgi:hypothetical protein